jgi:Restriction endonuclease
LSGRFRTTKFIDQKKTILDNALLEANDFGRVKLIDRSGVIPNIKEYYLILQDDNVYLMEYYSTWLKYSINDLNVVDSNTVEYSKFGERIISIKGTGTKSKCSLIGISSIQLENLLSYKENSKGKKEELNAMRREVKIQSQKEAKKKKENELEIKRKMEEEKINKFYQEIQRSTNQIIENEKNYKLSFNFFDQFMSDIFKDIRYFVYEDYLLSNILNINKKSELYLNNPSFIEEPIKKFINLLIEKKYVKKNMLKGPTGILIILKVMQNISIKYFSQKFQDAYSGYFIELKRMNLDDCVSTYFLIDVLDKKSKENISLFSYFLLNHNKIIENKAPLFYTIFNVVENKIESLWEEIQLNQFEAQLLTDRNQEMEKLTIDDIDLMSGHEFEYFINDLFKKMGYSVNQTKSTGDQGIDVIAVKRGLKIGIQAKCYSGSVSNKAIQEVVAGMKYYRISKGIVVTNNYFTNSAIELAKANDIILWDRLMLKEKIQEYYK